MQKPCDLTFLWGHFIVLQRTFFKAKIQRKNNKGKPLSKYSRIAIELSAFLPYDLNKRLCLFKTRKSSTIIEIAYSILQANGNQCTGNIAPLPTRFWKIVEAIVWLGNICGCFENFFGDAIHKIHGLLECWKHGCTCKVKTSRRSLIP